MLQRIARGAALTVAVSIICMANWTVLAGAENPPAKAPQDKTAAEKKKTGVGGDEEKIPDPENLSVTTGDGVRISITFYPSNRGKEAVPVILLHQFQGNRADYKELALLLQSKGFAVIVPDLRGHGDSTKQNRGDRETTLSAAKMSVENFRLMVEQDMYAIKEFLWERNNNKELNLNKLCVVGAEMGASVALNFAAFDAVGYGDSDRGAYYGTLQLGRFVKALVLLSPEMSYKGLSFPAAPLEDQKKTLPVLILAGKDDPKSLDEADRVAKFFKRPAPKEQTKTTYFFQKLDGKLQGTKLLEVKKLSVSEQMIYPFLKLRMLDSDDAKDWTWKALKKPHE
jgi:alpha-beta hydrolase superfamily lysophospholipase